MNTSKASSSFQDYIPGMVVFGDSTVDVGNNNYLQSVVKSNFAPYGRTFPGNVATGRFCDGKLAVDLIGNTSLPELQHQHHIKF